MKNINASAAVLITAAVVCLSASCGRSFRVRGEDDVAGFLSSNGVSVAGSCTEKTVTIPAEFGEVYEGYNDLQKRQGFDLSRYRDREAKVYTFPVAAVDGEHTDCTEAHVMVCDGEIIGCDISSPALDGGMEAVIR